MVIVGLGGLTSDPACAVLVDGKLAAAVEQKKLASANTAEAIQSALRLAGVTPADVATVALARPFPEWAGGHRVQIAMRSLCPNSRIVSVEHHHAHAASAYYASPYDRATVLTLDSAGDFRCGARWLAEGPHLTLNHELSYPDSLGDLYSRVTELLGFHANSDEHKVQWLSTSATPTHSDLFRSMLPGLRLDRSWFDAGRPGAGGFSAKLYASLGLNDGDAIPEPMKPVIAASLQRAVEQMVAELAGQGDNLCLAGGLALNALLVASLEQSGNWRNVFVQPAAGNSGTSIGAAYYAWHTVHGRTDRHPMTTVALGPEFSPEQIKQVLENCKLGFRYMLTTGELLAAAVDQLSSDKIVAWMQGRMEFGSRALGNRSILASPLNSYSTENLNVYIKHREPFRKFAASVPVELANEYFEIGANAHYLATVGRARAPHRKTFQSAVLGGDLVRVHTVDAAENPLFHQLLLAWGRKTGLPVLYNTSFNLLGAPMVCTPRDAVRSFYSSGIDALIAGHFLLEK